MDDQETKDVFFKQEVPIKSDSAKIIDAKDKSKIPLNTAEPPPEVIKIIEEKKLPLDKIEGWVAVPVLGQNKDRLSKKELTSDGSVDIYKLMEPLLDEPVLEKTLRTMDLLNGESYEMVKERMQSFLDDLKKNYDGKHVAIVAHKAPQLALDVILKGMTWKEAFKND